MPSVRGGYIVDYVEIEKRKDCNTWYWFIFGMNWILWMGLTWTIVELDLPGWGFMLSIGGLVIFLFVIAPSLAFLPWEIRVRKQANYVVIPLEIGNLLESCEKRVLQHARKIKSSATLAAKIAGMIAEHFGGKVVGKVTELVIENSISKPLENSLFEQDLQKVEDEIKAKVQTQDIRHDEAPTKPVER